MTGNSAPPPGRTAIAYDRFRTLAAWLTTLALASGLALLLLLIQLDWRFGTIPEPIFAILALAQLSVAALLGLVVRLRADLAAVSPGVARLLAPIEALFARIALGRIGEPRALAKTLEFQLYALLLGFAVAVAYVLFVVLHIGWLALAVFGFTIGSAVISLGGLGLARSWLWQRVRRNAAGQQDAT